jgi:hypothetical protein
MPKTSAPQRSPLMIPFQLELTLEGMHPTPLPETFFTVIVPLLTSSSKAHWGPLAFRT